jgi:PKD repeat protein
MVNAPADDRGQLILVAGLVIALLVFGIVVLLNSVLFVSNVAPHQATTNIEDGSAYRAVVADNAERIVNESAAGKEYVYPGALRRNVSDYSARMGEVAAETGPAYLDVRINDTASETMPLLVQNSSGQFASDRDGKNWRMFNDGTVKEFRMTTDGNSYTASEKFTVALDDGTDVWRLSIFKKSGDVTVETARNGAIVQDCPGFDKSESLHINTTTVTGDGRGPCSISFASGLDDSYTLDIVKGNQIETTYRVLVDGDVDPAHTSDPGSPYRIDAITSAAFDVTYDTPQISYETTVTDVRPNGATSSSTPPHAAFTQSEEKPSVGSSVTFDASASSDPDGTVSKYYWTFGDGTSATGKMVTKSFTEPGVYDVELTVTDDSGKTTTTTSEVYPYLALNAHGPSMTTGSTDYINDGGYAVGGNQYDTEDDITGVGAANIYRTERYGDFTHEVSVPNGKYTVKLQFAEIFQTSDNSRRFNVYIEGDKEVSNFDIHKQIGHDVPMSRQATVTVTDGELMIRYETIKDNAKISGVVVRAEESP